MSSQDSNSSGSQMLLEDDATVSSKPSSSQSVRKKKTVKKKVPPLTLNMTNCKYEVVQSCCKNFGFKIVDDPKLWSLFWIDTGVSIERILDMTPFQKINHFPGMHEICRKNHLARNLVRFSKVFPKEYNFSPKTWSLPVDWVDFRMAHKARKKTVYIVKPDHGCQGKGIFLARGPKQIAKIQKKQKLDQFMVVQ